MNGTDDFASTQRQVDWHAVRWGIAIGAAVASLKLLGVAQPALKIGLHTVDAFASILTAAYIAARVRHDPAKLDEWGITARLSPTACAVAAGLLLLAAGSVAAGGYLLAGGVPFKAAYLTQMLEYVLGAFPQQFFMCSVGLNALATRPVFRGAWRLPIAVGLLFALAHFWTPARIPGTFIPIQMPITFVAGFGCAYYFLRFRSILPLVVLHAVIYPLLHHWIEAQL